MSALPKVSVERAMKIAPDVRSQRIAPPFMHCIRSRSTYITEVCQLSRDHLRGRKYSGQNDSAKLLNPQDSHRIANKIRDEEGSADCEHGGGRLEVRRSHDNRLSGVPCEYLSHRISP